MNKPRMVIAIYTPKAGKEKELGALVRKHFATLKDCGLTTQRDSFIARSTDGSFVEVFEWISEEAARKAHDHPAVAKVWEAMAQVGDFPALGAVPEAKNRFAHFESAF